MSLIHKYLNWARRSPAYHETLMLEVKILSDDPHLSSKTSRRLFRANRIMASIIQWVPAFVVTAAITLISLIIIRFT